MCPVILTNVSVVLKAPDALEVSLYFVCLKVLQSKKDSKERFTPLVPLCYFFAFFILQKGGI